MWRAMPANFARIRGCVVFLPFPAAVLGLNGRYPDPRIRQETPMNAPHRDNGFFTET